MKDSGMTNYKSNSAKADKMCPFNSKRWGRFYEPSTCKTQTQ